METVYSGQHTLSALKGTRVKGNTILRRDENPKEKGRVRNCPTLHEGLPQNEGPRKERVLQERESSQLVSPSQRVIVQEEMPVIIGIRLNVLFYQKRVVNLGISVRSQTYGKDWRRANEEK